MKLNKKTDIALDTLISSEKEKISREFQAMQNKDTARFDATLEANRDKAKMCDTYSQYFVKEYQTIRENNSVYRGDYQNKTEEKDEALSALAFASSASQALYNVNFELNKQIFLMQSEVLKSTSASTFRSSNGEHYSEETIKNVLDSTAGYKERVDNAKTAISEVVRKARRKNTLVACILGVIGWLFVGLGYLCLKELADGNSTITMLGNIAMFLGVFGGFTPAVILLVRFKKIDLPQKIHGSYVRKLRSCYLELADQRTAKIHALFARNEAEEKKNYGGAVSGEAFKDLIQQCCLGFLPQEMRGYEAVIDMNELMKSGRANTLKEVFSLEEDRIARRENTEAEAAHRSNVLKSQQVQEEHLRKQSEYAQVAAQKAAEMAENSHRAAIAAENAADYAKQTARSEEEIASKFR